MISPHARRQKLVWRGGYAIKLAGLPRALPRRASTVEHGVAGDTRMGQRKDRVAGGGGERHLAIL